MRTALDVIMAFKDAIQAEVPKTTEQGLNSIGGLVPRCGFAVPFCDCRECDLQCALYETTVDRWSVKSCIWMQIAELTSNG